MTRKGFAGSLAISVSMCVGLISPARADLLFEVSQPNPGPDAYIVTMDVSNVANPVFTYQITGIGPSDIINADSFDPNTDRLYYVDNSPGQATLDYAQLNAQGKVVGQFVVGSLSPQISVSYGADYYEGRVWLSQNGSNIVYGFDPNNLSNSPIELTLPTPAGNSNTQFFLGDLTFNDAANTLFITGEFVGTQTGFFYEYSLSGSNNPSLIADRIYMASASDPIFNGMIFDQATSQLYAYANANGQLYTIDTSTLTIASDVGSNPYLFYSGDLAGFISVPEPSNMLNSSVGALILLTYRLIRMKVSQAAG